jgi:hypothetical protein
VVTTFYFVKTSGPFGAFLGAMASSCSRVLWRLSIAFETLRFVLRNYNNYQNAVFKGTLPKLRAKWLPLPHSLKTADTREHDGYL